MPPTSSTEARSYLALANPLSRLLDKPAADFTRADMIEVIEQKQIERITFHYTAIDGKLKELKLPVSTLARAERILAEGERVDGSSLFNGVVETGMSDLYVVPVYRTAFLNPFDERSLDFVCRFFDRDGKPASFAPDNILRRASESLFRSTGLQMRTLGELEFYLLSDDPSHLYRAERQRGYHASAPFVKSAEVVDEMLHHLEQITGAVKYGHGEVGWIGSVESENPELHGRVAEQYEIEFLPRPVDECADALVLAKWLIRNVAYRHGTVATFTPKLEEGIAGNGMHVHMELTRNDRNVMTNSDGSLSNVALQLIGGLCANADVLTALGNTMASSFLRLVPKQEAPTHICWSDMNRAALIRVPLGWNNVGQLSDAVNRREPVHHNEPCQSVELRTPDGSALIHLLLAGIVRSAEQGLTDPASTRIAEDRYIGVSGVKDAEENASPSLPHSCSEAATLLQERREFFEHEGLFPPRIIDYVLSLLRREQDERLAKDLKELGPQQRARLMRKIMHRDPHRH